MKIFYSILFMLLIVGSTTLSAQETYTAILGGRHEVLPVASNGIGTVEATLDGTQLTVSGSFAGMDGAFATQIGAHLHLGYAGENGPVAVPLTAALDMDGKGGTFAASDNTFTLDESQIAALQARQMYVNIHTDKYNSGELRGQLLPEADAYYYINLLGSNEVPVAMTQAAGALALELHGDTLIATGAFAGLEGDFDANVAGGAHLHAGMTGSNGAPEIFLNATTGDDLRTGIFTANENAFVLNDMQKTRLESRGYYANLHTTKFPGGELRGQTAGISQVNFRAHLAGANENPVVTSAASGQIQAELIADTLIVSGSFTGLESMVATQIAGGLHLHAGVAGTNGPVEVVLNATFDEDMMGGLLDPAMNTFVLSSTQRELLMNRGMYINIHTMGNTGGELRGQLLPESQIVFHGNLSGIFEIPNAVTQAYGVVKGELNGSQLIVSGSYHDLSGMVDLNIAGGAHLHLGAAGENGGIEFPLTSTFGDDMSAGEFDITDNTFTLDSAQIANIRSRKYYVNIHTTAQASGELRAQLLQEASYYFTAPLSGTSETPAPVNTDARGMLVMEVSGEQVITHGAFSGLGSAVNTDILGGAHIHAGMAGQGGPVVALLNATLTADSTGGFFSPANNGLTLSAGKLDTLRMRGYYVNIHSMDIGSGELRGQALPLATSYFTTTLAGINEVQPVLTNASGALKLELNDTTLTVSGAFAGLQSAFNTEIAGGAHLHLAGPAGNGGVDLLLNTQLDDSQTAGVYLPDSNKFALTPMQIDDLFAGNYYANLHSTDITSGELRGQIVPEVNTAPMGMPTIISPADGAILPLIGEAGTLAEISWEGGATDETEVVHIWQVALDTAFENIVFQTNTGVDTSLTLTFGALDTLLASLGVQAGATAQVYHRAVLSDGANQRAGVAAEANFTRGAITSTNDLLADDSALLVYPTTTQDQVQLQAEFKVSATEAELIILNAIGQPIRREVMSMAGNSLQFTTNLSNQAAGMYWLYIRIDGQTAAVGRVLKQ